MLRALGGDLASMTKWSAPDIGPGGKVGEKFKPTHQVHKFAHYLPIYEAVIDQSRPIRMLAIGSFYEDSLMLWQEYLHRDSSIICVDDNSMLIKIAKSGKISVRIYDNKDDAVLREAAREFGPFDVILDEGNHTSSRVISSFRDLFSTALINSGVYVVEDIWHDYLKSYRDTRVSFIDFVTSLIDAMHAKYQVPTNESRYRVGSTGRIRELSVPAISPLLANIEIYDSIVLVRRSNGV